MIKPNIILWVDYDSKQKQLKKIEFIYFQQCLFLGNVTYILGIKKISN